MKAVDVGYLQVVATRRVVLKDLVITDVSFTDSDRNSSLRDLGNGDKHTLELKLIQNPMAETTRSEMDLYE